MLFQNGAWDKRETETSFLTKIVEIFAPPVLNERGRKEEELVYSISAAPHIAFSLLARA